MLPEARRYQEKRVLLCVLAVVVFVVVLGLLLLDSFGVVVYVLDVGCGNITYCEHRTLTKHFQTEQMNDK